MNVVNKYTNASGPAPAEFPLSAYNSLINRVFPITEAATAISIIETNTIPEVDGFIAEYQRQANVHGSRGDSYNKAIAVSWRNTAQVVKTELLEKVNKLKAALVLSKKPKGNIFEAGPLTLNDLQLSNRDAQGNIIYSAPTEPVVAAEKKSITEIIKQLPKTLFYSRDTGKISYLKIGGTIAVLTGLGFGVRYLIKKFTK